MSLVTHALKISNMELEDITLKDSSTYFVVINSFNSISGKVSLSSDYVFDELKNSKKNTNLILLIILIVVTLSIVISLVVILRVIIKVTKNKEEILVLFTEIPSRNIKHQLKLCKKCFNNLRDTNEEEFGNEKSEEETKEEKEEQDVDELEEDEDKKNDDGSEFIKGFARPPTKACHQFVRV